MFRVLIIVLTAALFAAVFFLVPPAEGLGDYVRLVFFHVPAAWVSVLAFLLSAWWALRFLRCRRERFDALSARSARLGFFFVIFATATGALFSRLSWGAWWNWDPRQTTIFVLILIYGAYLTLRSAVPENRGRALVSAVYSLFSFLTVPFLVFLLPRLYFSLHPEPLLNSGAHVAMEPLMLGVLALGLIDATLLYFALLFRSVKED